MLTQFSVPGRARLQQRLGLALLPAALLVACGDAATTTGRVYRDPLTFGRTSLPVAYQGEPYEETLEVRGGTGPYGVKVSGGELPDGLTLKNQRLFGTPTETGTFRFTLEASDANLSSKAQEYTLNVNDLPPLKLSPKLPPAEIRGVTRIPLNIVAPRTARAARVTWELPAGAKVTRVQAGPSNGLLKWSQKGQTLTLDMGFKTVPQADEQVALVHVEPSRPLTLDAKAFGFRVLDGSGKELAAQLTPAQQAAQKAKAPVSASGAATSATASGAAVSEASGAATAPAQPSATPVESAPTTSSAAAEPLPAEPAPPADPQPTEPQPAEPQPSTPPVVKP